MGCLARVGCVALVVIIAVVGWLNRDRWLHPAPVPTALTGDWAPLTDAGATRTSDALAKLSSRNGPVFVTLSGSDVAAYVLRQIAKSMPPSTDSVVARIQDDQIRLRTSMNTKDLGSAVGGVLGALLRDRERVELGGSLHVIGKGLAEFRVSEVKVRGVGLPSAVISRLVNPLIKEKRPPGLDDNAIPVSIPPYIGDVRVANGRITLYKNVQ